MKDGIKALTFDVGGSIFDWQTSTRSAVRALAESKGVEIDDEAFAFDWRRRMFETLGEVRAGDLSWRNADQIHRDKLDELAQWYPRPRADRGGKRRAQSRLASHGCLGRCPRGACQAA